MKRKRCAGFMMARRKALEVTEQIPKILIIRQKEGDESVTILSICFCYDCFRVGSRINFIHSPVFIFLCISFKVWFVSVLILVFSLVVSTTDLSNSDSVQHIQTTAMTLKQK